MEIMRKSRGFIYKNARPLDLARWNYLFENANKQDVILYLKAYQNADGGFANALEPDCWNGKSTPMQTWAATKIIKEIEFDDKTHPLIKGMLEYLASGDEFSGYLWNGLNTVISNNNDPHAPWWSYTKTHESSYNPTASLAGFILKYADKHSSVYHMACQIAREAYNSFKERVPLESMHEAACFVELYEYLKEADVSNLLDLEEFKRLLQQQIKNVITYETNRWSTDYVCKPSLFINSKKSDFYPGNEDICSFECDFIMQTQNDDGTWNVTWNWDDFSEEWAVSKNWWKSDIVIRNIAYIKSISPETLY